MSGYINELRLIKNVNLNKYHTKSFRNNTDQKSWFVERNYKYYNNYRIVRDGTMQLPITAEEVKSNVNYLMFRNLYDGDNSKWYYAFITNIIFISDSSCEITYELDLLQSYMFDMIIKDSFVERETVADDTAGIHTVDENLDTGEIITVSQLNIENIKEMCIVVATTFDLSLAPENGTLVNNVFTGSRYYACKLIYWDAVRQYLNQVIATEGKSSGIVSIFQMPIAMVESSSFQLLEVSPYLTEFPENYENTVYQFGVSKQYLDLDGYVPKNAKLFTHPYNFARVTNNKGNFVDIKYEYCDDAQMVFNVYGDVKPDPSILVTLNNYYGQADNLEESVVLDGYPVCSWTNDFYANWVAQNRISNAFSVLSSAGAVGVGIATGNALAIGGGVYGVTKTIGDFAQAKMQPNEFKGQFGGTILERADKLTVTVLKNTVTREFAELLDQFFSMYGYKVNTVKQPQWFTRYYWNYVKTRNANIFGNINKGDLDKIIAIFDEGVTFWHTDDIGNYSLNNVATPPPL